MTRSALSILAIGIAVWLIPVGQLRPQGSSQGRATPLLGVWQRVAIESVGSQQRGELSTNPVVGTGGPALAIFTAKHWSQVAVSSATRPSMPDSNRTAADILAVWGPFSGAAGQYETRGDTLVESVYVAKQPGTMRPGFRWRMLFRIAGDTLWLTNTQEQTTMRYVRVE
jgi:hypothetical protein